MQLVARGLLASFLALAAACTRQSPLFPLHAADGKRPNLVLITVDTLRADHLGAYGYPVGTSPDIDQLAASGVRFANAIATAPETAPATASIMTGLYQYRSRVFFNRGVIRPQIDTLAERLRRTGYATAGFIGNGLVGAKRGFDQGFDTFTSFELENVYAPIDRHGADLVLAWLAQRPRRPWFLWIHFMDPHGPYTRRATRDHRSAEVSRGRVRRRSGGAVRVRQFRPGRHPRVPAGPQ